MNFSFKKWMMAIAAIFAFGLSWATVSGIASSERSWDFTKGANHADQITDCEYWNPDYASSKGRTTLLLDLNDQELPSNTGAALSGLEGIYFTVAKGAVYGISGNYCLQSGSMTVRIPDCEAGDTLKIGFCGAGSEATIASESINETLATSATKNELHTAIVTADGDVVLTMKCSKGFRLYTIDVKPGEAQDTPDTPAAGTNFEVDLAPSLFTEEEAVQWQVLPDFGVKMDEEGNTVRVAADAEDAQMVVTGAKYHGDHGVVPGTMTVKVAGNTKITIGGCNWGSAVTVTDANGGSFTIDNSGKCWNKSDESTMTSGYYIGEATTLTLTGGSYMRYYKFEAVDAVAEFNVTFNAGDAEGVAPKGGTVVAGESITIPVNRTLYSEGKTLVGWNDGKKTYKPGDTVSPKADMQLKPVFAANASSLQGAHADDVTVVWDFQAKNGAPTLAWQGGADIHPYVTQATINGSAVDVKMDCDVSAGKINNASWTDWCQMNSGTKLTIPAMKGMKIAIESYSATTTTTIAGSLGYTTEGTIASYEYNGTDKSIDIVIGDGSYWRAFTVTYPSVASSDEYDNTAGIISWANGNESNATATTDIKAAILDTKVSVGTDLTVSGPTSYSDVPEAKQSLMTYLPTTSNAGAVAGDMIEYKVKLKKGLTMKVSSVSFDAVKEGTDNAYFSWSYTADGVESKINAYSDPKNQIRRNNNANPSAPVTHNETVAADGCREFTLRFYISNVANDKKMSIGNIKINAAVSGTEEKRAFQDFAINFQSDTYKVVKPETGILPEGVEVNGTWHDSQHGYNTTTLTVPVDGPVKIKFGKCQYGATIATIKKGDEVLGTIDCGGSCEGTADWVYNSEEAATLTIITANYIPSIAVEACELLPMVTVSYYNTDGKLLGTEEVQGGSALAYKYSESDVTVPEGKAFRGWFTSEQQTALKIAEGYTLQDNLKLYARATDIEQVSNTARFKYDLTKPYFYVEDHELITIDGKYYNTHGWLIDKGGNIKVQVGGNCYLTIGNCLYSAESTATVTDADGNKVGEFQVKADGDGAATTIEYNGPATELTINFPSGAYTHSVEVWNFISAPEYDEATGYYIVAPGDVTSFLMALNAVASKDGAKIFLPNGTYDLGTQTLTSVSGKNISIIGQSMAGTVIVNAPAKENEGIGVTATLKNSANGLYMQDLTLRNAMTFNGGTGRAVTLQDCGNKTICKNVSLESYQDTYYSNNNSGSFYFEDGEIHGVVDYVCGGGDVYYNRVKFVNEQIKNTTIAAPNGAKKFGYVMNECTIDTKCNEFNFGRSWGSVSNLAWLNTTILQPSKLAKSRFTIAGMNVAADKFVEYNTMDASGNVISPASNVIEFTHSTGNKKYETILTAAQAAEYALDKVFTDWTPDAIAAQKLMTSAKIDGTTLSWDAVEGATAYAIFKDGVFVDIVTETSFTIDDATAVWTVRAANDRGGFGEPVTAEEASAINNAANAEGKTVKAIYNVSGQSVNDSYHGTKIIVFSDGTVKKINK